MRRVGVDVGCDIALELEIPRVVVPPHPGITSATGLLATDVVHEVVATAMMPLAELDSRRLEATYARLVQEAAAELGAEGFMGDRALVTRYADCRYAGQGYEVRFEVPVGPIDDGWAARAEEAFHLAHEREYGQRFDARIDIVNVRVTGVGLVPELAWPEIEAGKGDPVAALESDVVFDVGGRPERLRTPFYERAELRSGHSLAGPAVIEQYDSTTVIPPGLSAEIDHHGTIVIDRRTNVSSQAERGGSLSTPVLMRVIGGAFQSIAKEMGSVLFRMSYSSIIRESEDLGAGPVRVIAPKRSIFNPSYPRATKARFCQVNRMADFVLQALAPVIPDKVTAGNSASTTFLSYSGFSSQTDEYWIYLEVNEGSHGGKQGADGWDAVDSLIANTRNNPIEELEWRFPMRTERYELRDVHAAPGAWRGGIGTVRVNRFLADTLVACEGDRFFGDPPWGIFGGHPGLTATLRKNPGQPDEERWPSKFTNQRLRAGDAIEITVPCSGGFGDPVERDHRAVLDDVLDGFASLEQARDVYLVAIEPETMTIDEAETARLRARAPVPVR